MNEEKIYDAIILGAGGAGLMCAIQAGRYGRKVALLDHSATLGGKILISGGGRCNFTNLGASPKNYVSKNPHFAKSALARFTPEDFLEFIHKHNIGYHEKKLGQQFCDHSAKQIVAMLRSECEEVGAEILLDTKIHSVTKNENFEVETSRGTFVTPSLVVATGGLSIPKIGATGLGYEIAKQFGHSLIPRAAALDGFTLASQEAKLFEGLAGLSCDVTMSAGGLAFRENILFTHAGLSGPASLQASLHWYEGQEVEIDFLPEMNFYHYLKDKKTSGSKLIVKSILSEKLPSRLVDQLCEQYFNNTKPVIQIADQDLEKFAELLHHFKFIPSGTVGYSKAEVTRGGVNTDELSSKTMESKLVSGLYFIGEVVDVTGWLGGYNFQWAWASATAAGQAL